MTRRKKPANSEDGGGAPLWMVTFSDCMNLLLTFFVLLVTFSSFGEDRRQALWGMMRSVSRAFGTLVPDGGAEDRSAMVPNAQIWATEEPDFGSDKPTGATAITGRVGAMKEDIEFFGYQNFKVFRIPSRKVFLGRGAVLSPEGRYILAPMAAFLREMVNKVVVSENGPDLPSGDSDIGLTRSWAVVEYFTALHKLDDQRFSISAQTTLFHDTASEKPSGQTPNKGERILEIVLLEGSVIR